MKKIISLCLSLLMTLMSLQVSDNKILAAVEIPTANYIVNANQTFVKDHTNDLCSDDIKITAPSKGMMTITFTGSIMDLENKRMAYATLKDEKDNYYYNKFDKKATFSIPANKGDTFVLNVLCKGTKYSVEYSVKKIKTFSKATSRKKAPKLKKNKTVNGAIFLSDKVKDAKWYKINVKKKSKIKVTMKLNGDGYDYDILLYNKKGKKVSWSVDGSDKKQVKLKKGTYYIKVTKTVNSEKEDFPVYGTYTLKWK